MNIKKLVVTAGSTAVLLLATITPTFAATAQFGPYPSTSTDGGSCGQPWANDTFDRYFSVRKTGNDTYEVRQDYKNGTFETIGPISPGACSNTQHGTIVPAGIKGKFSGTLVGTVTSATYDPNGCDADPSVCTTTAGFVAAVFPGGTYSCLTGVGVCKFNFLYDAFQGQGLGYTHWQDTNDGGGEEVFRGDIALKNGVTPTGVGTIVR